MVYISCPMEESVKRPEDSFDMTRVLHLCTCCWLGAASFISTLSVSTPHSLLCLSLSLTGLTPFSPPFSRSLWRWTTPLWRENLSLRLAPRSSRTTILWRPATSVSFPPTVSRVSRPHLAEIVSSRLQMSFPFSHLEINIDLLYCPITSVSVHDPSEEPSLHPTVQCVVIEFWMH